MGHPYSRFHLMTSSDYQLHLDPAVEAEINALLLGPNPRLRSLVLFPNWLALQPTTLDQILRAPPPHASGPIMPRGEYHGTPRAADVGDLMQAIWAVPAVQGAATRLLDQVSHDAEHQWRSLSTGQQALVISSAGLILGGSLAGLLSNNQARQGAFQFLLNKDIPVPGVSGLSVRMLPRGASATYQNIAGSGVTVSAGAQAGGGLPTQVQAMVTLDVMHFFRRR
jgi:hypothetical protein